MAYQMTFKRYELKYLLNKQEKEEILLCNATIYEAGRLWKNGYKKYLF